MARIIFWAIMVLGIAAAVLLAATIRGTEIGSLASGSLPAGTALLVMAVFVIAMIASLVWLWIADEHETAAYNFGGILAIHAYFTVLPLWLLGWWGALLPEPDHLLIFMVTAFAWCAGWGWRRFH